MINPFLTGNALKILNPVISSRENLVANEEDTEATSEEGGSNPKPDGDNSTPGPGKEHLESIEERSEPSHQGQQAAVVAAGQEPKESGTTGNHKTITNDFELEGREGSVGKNSKTDELNVVLLQPREAASASAGSGERDAPEKSVDAEPSKTPRDKAVPGELMKEPAATLSSCWWCAQPVPNTAHQHLQ